MVMGVFPDSLDPQFGYTTQSAEATWISYTGLVTYKHANGTAGATVIPGLATALPVVTNGGKTYTVTLRKGLKYSNGDRSRRADFLFSFERAVKLPWGGSGQFMTPRRRRRNRLLEGQGQDDLRDPGQQRHRQDRHPPDRPVRRVRQRAGGAALGLIPIGSRRSRTIRCTRRPAAART